MCKSVTVGVSFQIATPLEYYFHWQAETILFFDIPPSKLS